MSILKCFKKYLCMLMLGLMTTTTTIHAATKEVKTNELQVLVNITDPAATQFIMFTGTELTPDFFHVRNFGGYNYVKAQLYPGGTVDPNQTDYTVSKDGIPLTAENSIGNFTNIGFFVDTLNLATDLPPIGNVPVGTVFEEINLEFLFKKACCKGKNARENQLFLKIPIRTGIFDTANRVPLFTGSGIEINGTGCNKGAHGTCTLTAYFSPDPAKPAILGVFRFSKPVKYVIDEPVRRHDSVRQPK